MNEVANLSSVIGGAESEGGGPEFESADPWSGEPVARAQFTKTEDIARAVEIARGPGREWSQRSWAGRGEVLAQVAREIRAAADELISLVVREVGKPVAEAGMEVERTARVFDFYAQEGRRAKGALIPADEPGVAVLTRRRPVGPVALITPWNFPLAIPAWKMAPALLCGNPVIWKPASQAIACAKSLTDAALRAGLPPASVSLVLGSGEIGRKLLDQPLAAASFTGSTAVGAQLREQLAGRNIPLQLELGGRNAAIVLDDADPSAAEAIARAAFGYAGQKCTATSVVMTEPGIHERISSALAAAAVNLPWGDPKDSEVWGGPLIDEEANASVSEAVQSSRDAGAQLLGEWTGADRATVFPPTVLGVSGDERIAREEVFGPVLGLFPAAPAEQLVDYVNDTPYGLVASIYGKDMDRIRTLLNQLEVGVIAINRPSTGLEVQAPFGGWKDSGGSDPEQGVEAIRFFTKSQTIYWKSGAEDAEIP